MTFSLYWIRPDGKNDYTRGSFSTKAEATAAIPAAKRKLIKEFSEEWVTQLIEDGTWSIEEDPAAESIEEDDAAE